MLAPLPAYAEGRDVCGKEVSAEVLYLSDLNMKEGILTKNNWLRFPPKLKEAMLNIMGGDLFWILTTRA